jgi:hypothetical protein
MFDGQPLPIIITSVLLISSLRWFIPLVRLAWFDPFKLKEILVQHARNHPLNAYNPKYNWDNTIWSWKVFGLVILLVSLIAGIGLALDLIDLIRSIL